LVVNNRNFHFLSVRVVEVKKGTKMRCALFLLGIFLALSTNALGQSCEWPAGGRQDASAPSPSQLMAESIRDGEGRDRDDERRDHDQVYWFVPLYGFQPDGAGGVKPYVQLDYMNLFAADSPWAQARGRIRIFKIYGGLVRAGPDSAMATIFAYLKQHHIALGLEWGPLTATAQCGANVEGYSAGPSDAIQAALKIKSLGGELAYVAMDEPLYFGHYSQGPATCQAPIATVAQQAGATALAFKSIFPDVQIGDIEPVNSVVNAAGADKWLADTKAWIEGFRNAAGFPLAFFHNDADWSVPLNRFIPDLQGLLEREEIPFGMIFDGADYPVSDAGWMAAAEEHIQAYNHSGNAPPDHVIFQTWNAFPTHALPETSPTAQSYLVDFYFSPQAQLSPAQILSKTKNAVLLPAGAVFWRSDCDLNTLGAAAANPVNEVAYSFCLVLARAAGPAGLQAFAPALANHSITLQFVLDAGFTSTEFQTRFSVASMSNSDFVAFLYGLVLFRLPTREESDRYVTALERGIDNRQQVFDSIIHTPEFVAKNPILSAL
jgi:hypothetical protein